MTAEYEPKKTPKMRDVEALVGEPLEEFLSRRYTQEGATIREIIRAVVECSEGRLRTSTFEVCLWFTKLGLQLRTRSEAGKIFYEKHPEVVQRKVQQLRKGHKAWVEKLHQK